MKNTITNMQIAMLNVIARIEEIEYAKYIAGSGVGELDTVWLSATGIASALGYKRATTYHLRLLKELVTMKYIIMKNEHEKNWYTLTSAGATYVNNLTLRSDVMVDLRERGLGI